MGDPGSTTPIVRVFAGGGLEGRNRPIRETSELTDEIQRALHLLSVTSGQPHPAAENPIIT